MLVIEVNLLNFEVQKIPISKELIYTLSQLSRYICKEYNIKDLKTRSRKLEKVMPRHIFFGIARKYFKKRYSLSEIGKYLGFDHSTVIYACHKCENKWDLKPEFKRVEQELKGILYNISESKK